MIAVDATSVSPAGKGLARVQAQTVRALAALGAHDLRAYVADEAELGVPTVRVRRRPAVLWEQVGLARAARAADAVLTWRDRLPLTGGRFVVWLFELPTHRMTLKRTAGAYQRASDLLTRALWRPSLRRAARLLASSQATAAELAAELPELGEVQVVYPGLDERFSPGEGRGGRYVLHVGSGDARENTESVVEAVRRANERLREPIRLVVAGDARRRDAAVEYVGRVSDTELIELYRGAAAYLDATLHEGFGLQPLEALACGAPVVASTASAVPEVVGDAALLCAPHDREAQARALVRVLEQPGLAADLRRRGLERARQFTWERTARELANVLDEVTR